MTFRLHLIFPAGHIRDNRTLIMGREVSLKVKGKKATVKFAKSWKNNTAEAAVNKPIQTKKEENKITLGTKPFKG